VPEWRLGIKATREITLDKGRAISVMDAKVISSRFPEAEVKWFDGHD